MRTALIAIPVLLAATAGGATTFVKVRGELAQQRAVIASEWTAVDHALQQRSNLIGDLAEAGRKLAPFKAQTLKEIDDSRAAVLSGLTPQDKVVANLRLSNALAEVLLQTENQPNLRTNPAFLRLQEEIRNSEDRIAEARLKYNDALEHYNARIQSFPQNLVAKFSGFARNDAYFPTEHF